MGLHLTTCRLHPSVQWEICERDRKQEASGLNGTGCAGKQEQEGGVIMSGFIPGRGAVSVRQSVAPLHDMRQIAWDRKFNKSNIIASFAYSAQINLHYRVISLSIIYYTAWSSGVTRFMFPMIASSPQSQHVSSNLMKGFSSRRNVPRFVTGSSSNTDT